MSEQQQLISAILREPADDLVRLVYADWLQENNEPNYAEFIRVQIALTKEGNCASSGIICAKPQCEWCKWCVERHELQREQKRLFDWYTIEKLAEKSGRPWLRTYVDPTSFETTYVESAALISRGFVERIQLRPKDFMGCAELLFRNHPITGVTLTGMDAAGNDVRAIGWHRHWPDNPEVDDVHRDLWPYLVEVSHEDSATLERYWIWYETDDDADLALSRACVEYGRAKAGLRKELT